MSLVFLLVSVIALALGWSLVFQRLVTYSDMQIENDSLIRNAIQIDSLKTNVMKINRYLEYFRMI
jgi:hypothetical protein